MHNVKSRLPGIQSQKIQFRQLALLRSLLSATIKIFILWQLNCEAIYGDNTQKQDTYVSSQVLRTSPHSWFKSNQIRQRWDDNKVIETADLPTYYWAGGGNPTSKNRKKNIKTIILSPPLCMPGQLYLWDDKRTPQGFEDNHCVSSSQTKTKNRMTVVITLWVSLTKYQITFTMNAGFS